MSEDIAKLRADYAELVGKPPFNGWGAEELQKRIDAALSDQPSGNDGAADESAGAQDTAPKGKAKRAEKLIPVRINRDFWDAEGNRHRKGTVVEVPVEAALDGVETGALSRVK